MTELSTIAWALLGAGVLLAVSAFGTRLSRATPVPVVLLFLSVGIVAGSEGLGGIQFDDHRDGFWIGTIALVVVLFGGALSTNARAAQRHVWPAAVLATFGVAITAGLVAIPAVLFGFEWKSALLLGAVVSSTDAAAVFSVLRTSNVKLSQRVGMTLELESGMNDPMAVILTVYLTGLVLGVGPGPGTLLWRIPLQFAVGIAVGIAVGSAARFSLRHLPPFTSGLFPVLTVAFAMAAFGGATLLGGSGFLAVYVAGLALSAGKLPYRIGLSRVHDFLGWMAQVVMFLILGLLVFPSQLVEVAVPGLAIALFLAVVARPLRCCSVCCRLGTLAGKFFTSAGSDCAAPCRSCWQPFRFCPGWRAAIASSTSSSSWSWSACCSRAAPPAGSPVAWAWQTRRRPRRQPLSR